MRKRINKLTISEQQRQRRRKNAEAKSQLVTQCVSRSLQWNPADLQAAQTAADYSLRDIQKQTLISPPTIAKTLSGDPGQSIDTLVAVADTLGLITNITFQPKP